MRSRPAVADGRPDRIGRRRARSAWLCLLLGLSLAAAGAPQGPGASAEDVDEAREALDTVLKRLNALDTWLDDAERKRVRWLQEVRDKDREVAAVSRRVASAADAVQAVRSEMDKLEAERSRLQAQRTEQARQIGEHLSAAYRLTGQDFIKLILNQQSPETFDRMMRYHRYFSEVRLAALAEYEQTLASLNENAALLAEREAEANRRQEVLEAQQADLEAGREERKRLLASLEAEAVDKAAERKRLEADRERLEQLLAELIRRAEVLDGKAFAARKGKLSWPLNGRVTNAFGQPRAEGRLVWHGLMISADEGTEIRAVFRGRVVFSDWLRGFGLLTIIDHGSGYMTLYGNADLLTRQVGDWVEAGETIARAGRSGGQSRTGLYFEVRQDGEARDPIIWLAKR